MLKRQSPRPATRGAIRRRHAAIPQRLASLLLAACLSAGSPRAFSAESRDQPTGEATNSPRASVPEPATNTNASAGEPDAPERPPHARLDSLYDRISAEVVHLDRVVDRLLCRWFTPDDYETSETMDRFFGPRDDAGEDSGRTDLRFAPALTFSRQHLVRPRGRFGLTMNVPRFRDRLQLVAGNFQQDEDVLPSITDYFSRQRRVTGQDDESAGLRLVLVDRLNYGMDAGAGVRFRPEPVPKLRLKGGVRYRLDAWEYGLNETGFWQSDDGFGVKTELVQTRALNDRFIFTASEAVLREETLPGLTLGTTLSLRRNLGGDRTIGLIGAAEGSTEPSAVVNSYAVRVPYRQRFHRDWLHLTIEPGLDFENARDFQADPLITVGFDMRFGRIPGRKGKP